MQHVAIGRKGTPPELDLLGWCAAPLPDPHAHVRSAAGARLGRGSPTARSKSTIHGIASTRLGRLGIYYTGLHAASGSSCWSVVRLRQMSADADRRHKSYVRRTRWDTHLSARSPSSHMGLIAQYVRPHS